MAKDYTQNGYETNGDKLVENGVKMRDFGVFRLKSNRLFCLTQSGVGNNYYAETRHGKEWVVSSKKTLCRETNQFAKG
jgi:hypothetical protein